MYVCMYLCLSLFTSIYLSQGVHNLGVAVNMSDCDIIVNDLALQSCNYAYFRTSSPGKGMKPLIQLA